MKSGTTVKAAAGSLILAERATDLTMTAATKAIALLMTPEKSVDIQSATRVEMVFPTTVKREMALFIAKEKAAGKPALVMEAPVFSTLEGEVTVFSTLKIVVKVEATDILAVVETAKILQL